MADWSAKDLRGETKEDRSLAVGLVPLPFLLNYGP